jgi:molybdate transport system ATP-binding protein
VSGSERRKDIQTGLTRLTGLQKAWVGAEPLLSVRDASFRLGDKLVFENTNWNIRRGEQWAIVGANGSGKSLLGDALRGRLPCVQGEVVYQLKPPPGAAWEDCIGHLSFEQRKANVHEMVVQSRWNSLDAGAGLSVREFLSYEVTMEINPYELIPGDAKARRTFERRRRRAIGLTGLERFFERTVISLSNGETQRLQLARALCRPLRMLIVDEPFTGLDAASRTYFRDVLGRLMEEGLSTIIITNELEELPSGVTDVITVEGCRAKSIERRKRGGGNIEHRTSNIEHRGLQKHRRNMGLPVANQTEAPGRELVRMRNVAVKYGESVILKDINWTVRVGESWALLGPNGSGKSTLLSLIMGDNPQAYANDVSIFGQQRGGGASIWEIKNQIGWVSPELQVHFEQWTTCLEAVESGFHDSVGLFAPVTRRQRALARRWLARFDLLDSAATPLAELSTGIQRMVLLARALVKRPRLLLLDEPCQGLDAAHREMFLRTLDTLLQDGGETAIYVTHRLEEIPRSIKRVLELPNAASGKRQ